MNAESIIDEKGRICIPIELRRKLNLKSGEKVIFQMEGEKIILRKSVTPEEFSKKAKIFGEHLKKVTDKPVPIEKIFE